MHHFLETPLFVCVVSETLRMYPPVGMFLRECTKPYRIPDTNVTIERGTRVCVPIYALHKDPQYFPRPQLFNPERFSAEHPAAPHPFTYLPFGDGPRICIGTQTQTEFSNYSKCFVILVFSLCGHVGTCFLTRTVSVFPLDVTQQLNQFSYLFYARTKVTDWTNYDNHLTIIRQISFKFARPI